MHSDRVLWVLARLIPRNTHADVKKRINLSEWLWGTEVLEAKHGEGSLMYEKGDCVKFHPVLLKSRFGSQKNIKCSTEKSKMAIVEYIEITCKSQRRHYYLGYHSPDDY
jgi:hypothetical protein